MLMLHVLNALRMYWPALQSEEEGQGLVEYVLILVLISIVAIVVMGPLGATVAGVFTQVDAAMQ